MNSRAPEKPPAEQPVPDAPGPALPARYYTDPATAAEETRQVFEKAWQLVCHESDLPNPGARLAATVAGREVLVVRTEDGALAAHLNVCRHRGTRLVTAPEPAGKAIRCPYHGWTYRLDGRSEPRRRGRSPASTSPRSACSRPASNPSSASCSSTSTPAPYLCPRSAPGSPRPSATTPGPI